MRLTPDQHKVTTDRLKNALAQLESGNDAVLLDQAAFMVARTIKCGILANTQDWYADLPKLTAQIEDCLPDCEETGTRLNVRTLQLNLTDWMNREDPVGTVCNLILRLIP